MNAFEPIRVLVVDDEPYGRKAVLQQLEGREEFVVVGECRDGEEALRSVADLEPELVFLDVEMPGMNGFEVVRAVGDTMPAVVFVTAYERYAVAAFDAHAIDYVLKPIDPARFEVALTRVGQVLRQAGAQPAPAVSVQAKLDGLLAGFAGVPRYAQRLVIKGGGSSTIVPVAAIDWIEAADNYVRIHVGGTAHLQRETMSCLEKRLDPARFVRIHRSTLVCVDRVCEVQSLAKGDAVAILQGGTELMVSRRHRVRLEEVLRS